MSKIIRYRKTTRERLIELFERIGYKVTKQSTDGSWRLLRLPDGTSTDYWIFPDHIEHRFKDYRGGSAFYFDGCFFEITDNHTVAIVAKSDEDIYLTFHNFKEQS